jgi:hypothetical protein
VFEELLRIGRVLSEQRPLFTDHVTALFAAVMGGGMKLRAPASLHVSLQEKDPYLQVVQPS